MKKFFYVFILFQILLSLLAPASAHAHALLLESVPRDNAVLTEPPREAVLRFNARIEKGVSQAALLDEKGRRLPLPPMPKDDGKGSPDRLTVPLPSLKPGRYSLKYLVLATDGHATPGIIRFSISGGSGR